ncbi:hypothetical protein [Cryobacterium sp. TMT4-10]|nr:hypothetical protein [Cryobacterium sp. TMT4-10]TFD15535.1 hypothetical protein E3T42_10430 [Cryobacterium sp. TMT4-10]
MSSAERERQVLHAEAPQVDVAGFLRDLDELVGPQALRQRRQHLGPATGGCPAPLRDELPHIVRLDRVALGRDAAAHRVEEHVGGVVDRREFVAGVLGGVGGREDALQVRPGAHDVRRQLRGEGVRVAEPFAQADHVRRVLVDVGDDLPAPFGPGRQGDPGVDQVGAAPAADIRLAGDAPAPGECGDLVDREQVLLRAQPDLPGDVGLQGLAGFREVGEGRVERQQPEARPGVEFGPLVGVEEHAQFVLRLHPRAGGEDVHQAVDQVDLARLVVGE